ncbi:hypothetical protein [Puerhibacterium sp. TATVAM-FAB25]|uniref:hypothetical protein n=1 Tax=Puerhibacterium sp. TATVAM-FAB25 TaxID=3093699 RepID=UPI00397CCFD2
MRRDTTTSTAPTASRARVSSGPAGIVVPSRAVVLLTLALAVVAAAAAAVGLFASGGPGPHEVVTARGESVDVYGTGLYRHDSWLLGVGNRGTDAVTLFLEVPALLVALSAYRRRSVRGTVVLVGVLGWLLYYYASMSLYTAYHRLFGLSVLAFGLALFAAPLALRSVDPARFAAAFPDRPSRRALVGYLGGLAAVLTAAWAPPLVAAAVTGAVPARLDVYSTEVTWALDLAVVAPAVAATGWLLHRDAPSGRLAATAMLAVNVALGTALAAQGAAQLAAGVPVRPAEVVGAMVSFAVMTVVAATLLVPLLRRLPAAPREPDARPSRTG